MERIIEVVTKVKISTAGKRCGVGCEPLFLEGSNSMGISMYWRCRRYNKTCYKDKAMRCKECIEEFGE